MKKVISRRTKLLTVHGRHRYDLRVRRIGDLDSEIIKVKRDGKDFSWFIGDFYVYLTYRNRRPKRTLILVYEERIYILDRFTQKLITVFNVPERFLPTSSFLLTPAQRKIIINKEQYLQKEVKIQCKAKKKYEGTLQRVFYYEREPVIQLLDYYNNILNINLTDINSVQVTEK